MAAARVVVAETLGIAEVEVDKKRRNVTVAMTVVVQVVNIPSGMKKE